MTNQEIASQIRQIAERLAEGGIYAVQRKELLDLATTVSMLPPPEPYHEHDRLE